MILVAALILNSCENPELDFGVENIVLTKQLLAINMESSYFNGGEIDPAESRYDTVYVASIYRTGVFENPTAASASIAVSEEYMQQILDDLENPDVEQTNELIAMENLKGAKILPSQCYEIGGLDLNISSGENTASVRVILDKEEMAKIDLFSNWVLPSFSIEEANLPVGGAIEHSFVSIKMLKEYLPMPEDLSGYTNIVLHTPQERIYTPNPYWSSEQWHDVEFAVDGDNGVEEEGNRWIPSCKSSSDVAPEYQITFEQASAIHGFKIFYPIPNTVVRSNCDILLMLEGETEWKKVVEVRGNVDNIISIQLGGEQATAIKIVWDRIINGSANYAVKLKEVEVYTKN